jgi:phosphatidylserine/phosphatidylglycerophosphate/cardiolipin synthase-like enzyme
MPKATPHHPTVYPMRIQARGGSLVERRYYASSRLPGLAWPSPAAIAQGINPSPLEDLIFHGGKTVAHMGFKNLYVGSQSDWIASNVDFIDKAITRAMQDRRLNNVMAQYFPGSLLSCEALPSMILGNAKPLQIDEPDIEQQVIALFKGAQLGRTGFDSTVFNFILPPGVILKLGPDTSSDGLGGYHGSVHTTDASGQPLTLYYSASVFSQMLADGTQNGIVAFDAPWKNVVATLYHELNEFRTDADVNDAIRTKSNDPLGWMSRQGHECGDEPIFAARASLELVFREITPSDGGDPLPVQFLYSNVVHGPEGPVDIPDVLNASVKSASSAIRSMPTLPPRSQALMPAAVVIDRVIQAHLAELTKPGVLSVRPGYQASGGWITHKPAIVVTVLNKTDELAPADRLPETLAGFAVDVRQAGPLQRLRTANPTLFAAVAERAPAELQLAEFPLERDLSGQPVPSAELETVRTAAKLPLVYAPPPNAPLDPIDDTFTIVCHASPDAGWLQLQPFLTGTQSRLTVGMYDFTSAHILAAFRSTFNNSGDLQLVLDHPAPDRTSDQSDDDTQAALASTLNNRLQFAWALEAHDPHVTAALFPSAYHIKVAVRDGTAFWLSSGNWNNSNQPDINPFTNPSGATAILAKSDRDWHVIVTHDKLSALFEAYLQNDLNVAQQHQAPVSAASAAAVDALTALAAPDQAVTSRVPQQFFEPKVITARMTIQPVLTPDNYPATILALIQSAQHTLYIQIPYITPNGKPESAALDGLIAAVADRLRHGVDVRLILSSFAKLPNLEQLQAAGINNSVIRIQNNLHNKGIIIDSEVVVVGSQNWSPPGVTTNRDASLIIRNAEAAQYWERIFLYDWAHMATQHAGD